MDKNSNSHQILSENMLYHMHFRVSPLRINVFIQHKRLKLSGYSLSFKMPMPNPTLLPYFLLLRIYGVRAKQNINFPQHQSNCHLFQKLSLNYA